MFFCWLWKFMPHPQRISFSYFQMYYFFSCLWSSFQAENKEFFQLEAIYLTSFIVKKKFLPSSTYHKVFNNKLCVLISQFIFFIKGCGWGCRTIPTRWLYSLFFCLSTTSPWKKRKEEEKKFYCIFGDFLLLRKQKH